MKKRIFSVFIVSSILLLSACSENTAEVPSESHSASLTSDTMSIEAEEQAEAAAAENKVLIAYFSWAENAVQDNIDAMTSASVKNPVNVAQLAQWIENETGGDLFSIQVTEPYPADWDGCLDRANKEKADGTHPVLSETIDDISEYDTVFLGYPNWWYSCPMAIFSFIDTHDLSDKNIYLFCSHGTGGLAGSVQDITAALPESAVVSENVFHVFQDDTANAKEDLQEWLNNIK